MRYRIRAEMLTHDGFKRYPKIGEHSKLSPAKDIANRSHTRAYVFDGTTKRIVYDNGKQVLFIGEPE